jgi:dihydrofolate reductase
MRTITASFFMSLDGVVDAPHEWNFPYMNDEAQAAMLAGIRGVDTIVLGRVTYQEWLPVWPAQGTSNPMAEFLNSTPKLIVSTSLDATDWPGSTLVTGDVVDALGDERRKPGDDIAIFGSGTLVSSLLVAGLVDELRLMVHPLVVGRGKRLFDSGAEARGLELAATETFSNGVLNLTYRPVRQ